ncbi:universal stress protein [Pedobacter gandavensis]|uniref:Universal stress protein n=1 Tax=Pedobacter gandavensis TaxID=2679963 RepID=A0ABR6ESA2_9SPHI|nr:universal stress protein [Pedobacter gandavensis]MBB2148148.1 universal stress protein [Pedobacter gandavensis]
MASTPNIKVLAGLDLSEMDQPLIKYLKLLSELLPLNKVTFFHNIKQSELPESFKSPEQLNTIANTIKKKLEATIPALLGDQLPYDIEVSFEDYTELSFSKMAKKKQINLAVLGNKQNLEGNGGLAHKLIRMLPFETLLVPETYNPAPKKIIEAIDFSKYTPTVMQWGKLIKNHHQQADLTFEPINISKLSWKFFPGLSNAEIRKNTQEDIKMKSEKWAKLYPNANPLKVVPAEDKNIASALIQYVKKEKADLLIMGVQGVTSVTTLFMGSVANEVLYLESNACLLFVKHKIES